MSEKLNLPNMTIATLAEDVVQLRDGMRAAHYEPPLDTLALLLIAGELREIRTTLAEIAASSAKTAAQLDYLTDNLHAIGGDR